jgi:hypothetical protein
MGYFRRGTRHWWLLAITAVVVLVHAWLTWSVSALMKQLHPEDVSGIKRMEATYVSELKLSKPPVAAPAPMVAPPTAPEARVSKKRKRKPAPPAEQASAPEPEPMPLQQADAASAAASAAQAETAASAIIVAEAASAPTPAASAAEPAAPSASDPELALGPPFVWPLATRVSYKVHGYFRGEIYGQAKVEWIKQANNYQVHVDATLGPSFAPIGSWNLISAGTITPDGLSPTRFEQINRLLIRTSPPRTVVFEEHDVVLDSGERVRRTPGMQDAASQFIQLSYQFIMKPSLLKPGNVVYMTLALPKKLETIAYDVIEEETLKTPIGEVPAFHVKPRKMSAAGGTLPVEIWFAPGLQYLPVRILIRSDEKTYLDLQMERAPEQTPRDPS